MRLRRGDSTSVEVKRAAQGIPDSLGETLCAFANMPEGGTVVLGVDEKSGFTVTGIEDVAQMEAGVASLARTAVTPSPHVEFKTLTVHKKAVLVVAVTGLGVIDRPARFEGKAYLRQSDGDYVMNDVELRMLDVAKLHTDDQVFYDERPVEGTSIRDLDETLLEQYLRNARASSRRLRELSDEDLLRTTAVITPQGALTLAGLYAMGTYPQGKRPLLSVTAAVQLSGESGQRTRNRQDFDGPLPEMMEDLLDWVRQNADRQEVYGPDGQLREIPEFPMTAVRELIGNALVHRDLGPGTLGAGKGIQVRITARGLVIESPGGLHGLSVEQLRSAEHAQAAVNQRLYNIAKQLRTPDGARVIEGEGGGMREVFDAVRQAGLPEPQLVNTGIKFRAILWSAFETDEDKAATVGDPHSHLDRKSPSDVLPQGKNAPRLLQALQGKEELTFQEVVDATGLTESQVRYALKQLQASGHVRMRGRQGQRGTTYALDQRTP